MSERVYSSHSDHTSGTRPITAENIENAKIAQSFVAAEFTLHFIGNEFTRIPPVDITAKIDPTVRFVGAPISVMKPLIASENVPDPGVFLVQNCIRTANLQNLFQPDIYPEYGSFFTGMGALTPANGLSGLFTQSAGFLIDKMGVKPADLFISYDSADEDLAAAAESVEFISKRPDEKEPDYYDHVYGMPGVRGRNTSIWQKNANSDEYEDIGNIIVIEKDEKPVAVELALGVTTILKQAKGYSHVHDVYELELTNTDQPPAWNRKLEDSAITSLALHSEGLRPSAKNNQTRILRSYIKALSLYRRLLGMSVSELETGLMRMETGKLPFSAIGHASEIISHMTTYENNLARYGISNKEDSLIQSILKSPEQK